MSVWRDSAGVKPGWVVLIALVVCVAFVALLVLGVEYGPVRWGCRNTAQTMGISYRWSITTNCVVQVNDRWYPLEQVINGNVQVDS